MGRYNNNPKLNSMITIWREILNREPKHQEISKYIKLGSMMLVDMAKAIREEEFQHSDTCEVINRAIGCKKKSGGVSLVSTYNKQCGISTYTENLHKHLMKIIDCNVISDETRNRAGISTEEGVERSWSTERPDWWIKIINQAAKFENKIIHIQHEFGLFRDNSKFLEMLQYLKKSGFIIIITMHTVLENKIHDAFFSPADLMIVHSEEAADRLCGSGINANVTVIKHGSEDPITVTLEESVSFVNQFIQFKPMENVLGTSVGFISRNKMQVETMKAAVEASKKDPKIRFLLIGSCGRRSYDFDYFPKLQELQTDRVKVIQRFLNDQEIAMVLRASDFSIMNYEQTNHSISGASHLLMSYQVPSISSTARILSDLTPDVSRKVRCENIEDIKNEILFLASMKSGDWRITAKQYLKKKFDDTRWEKIARIHSNVYNVLERKNESKS